MYTADSPKELKKLMKEDKYPILVADEKTQKLVEVLESLKTNAISEPVIIAILAISLTSIIALYAIYKNKNIILKYNKDGSIELSTKN